ncbi:hypothetical protein DEO72_LG8g2256 [Vigna unguiculata]|uniref:Uncharacterized protein n=1 Tax=Vigna unguiculata TaxID=3917 RepID=A0A4D6MUF5_VIGUN|nr:hypothetical protein DEO72_LG8g2256 [Vigna unguiculata]
MPITGLSASNGRRRCGRLKTQRELKEGVAVTVISTVAVTANPRVRFRSRALKDIKFSNWFEEPNLRFMDHLRPLFPHMDDQILEKALQEIGNDLDALSAHATSWGNNCPSKESVVHATKLAFAPAFKACMH